MTAVNDCRPPVVSETLEREHRVLIFRAEAFNALNHFNPSNPSASLTYNCSGAVANTCNPQPGATSYLAQTNSNFGVISSAQVQARRTILSARFRF